jgi:hypothetical protein
MIGPYSPPRINQPSYSYKIISAQLDTENKNLTPNLFGAISIETALIEIQHRFIEFELVSGIGQAWINGPIVANMGIVESIPA